MILLDALSRGFVASPREILTFCALLVLSLTGLLLYDTIHKSRMRKESSLRAHEICQHVASKLNLTSDELLLIERMTEYLPPARGSTVA